MSIGTGEADPPGYTHVLSKCGTCSSASKSCHLHSPTADCSCHSFITLWNRCTPGTTFVDSWVVSTHIFLEFPSNSCLNHSYSISVTHLILNSCEKQVKVCWKNNFCLVWSLLSWEWNCICWKLEREGCWCQWVHVQVERMLQWVSHLAFHPASKVSYFIILRVRFPWVIIVGSWWNF